MTYFASTRATDTTCPRCRAAVLVALDEGLRVRADSTPLPDRQSEIAALLDGRQTYTLTAHRHLIHRTAERIATDRLRGTIHAEHKCVTPTQLTIDQIGRQ